MKRLFFPAVLISAMALAGCIQTPQQAEYYKRLDELDRIVKEREKSNNELRDRTGRFMADVSNEMDIIRQDFARLQGEMEERDFEFERVKENLELLGETVRTLDERLARIESGGAGEAGPQLAEGKEAKEGNLTRLKESIEEIKGSLEDLRARMEKIEKAGATAKEDEKTEEKSLPDPAALYMEGLDLVREKKDYLEGLQVFKRFLSLFPKHELADNAQYWIGEVYYVRGDWERAVLEFNKVIKEYPQGDKVPAALLKQGYSFEKLGALKEAKVLLKRVIEKYPKSAEAELAEDHLKGMK